MLPTLTPGAPTLADVLPSCLAALDGGENTLGLPRAERVLLVLVDGLGSSALKARAGHARHLLAGTGKRDVLQSGFPSTTAAALASLMTGAAPGQHGLVGYSTLVPAAGRVLNQLSGWSDAEMPPATWQRLPTLFERAAAADPALAVSAVGTAKYATSGLTRAILRGSDYVAAKTIPDRFAAARRLLDEGGRRLVYLYVPELDQLGHAHGWESDRWLAALELLDAEYGRMLTGLRPGEASLLTADHGVVDVPPSGHVLFGEIPELMAGVRHVGGDPRCVQLYLDPDATPADRERLAAVWQEREGSRAWIATREDAIAAGWFGEVHAEVRPRLGDVLVVARKLVAYYDGRGPDTSAQKMVGQHGSFTHEEIAVPLLRAGAFAR